MDNPRIDHQIPAEFDRDPATNAPQPPMKQHQKELLNLPLSLALRLFDDPLFPSYLHGAALVRLNSIEPLMHEYFITPHGEARFNRNELATLMGLGRGEFHLVLRPQNLDADDFREELVWPITIAQWDAFIARHWPGAKGNWLTDFSNVEARAAAGEVYYGAKYEAVEHGVVLLQIEVDFRLCDGKIGTLNVWDRRDAVRIFLRGITLPPPPLDKIIGSLPAALMAKVHQWADHNVANRIGDITNPQLISTERRVSFDSKSREVTGFFTSYVGQCVTCGGEELRFEGNYYESHETTNIYALRFEKRVYWDRDGGDYGGAFSTPERKDDSRYRYFVEDKQPSWSVDGKGLYFLTYHASSERPWWMVNRVSHTTSLACCHIDGHRTDAPSLIQPLRGLHNSGNFIGKLPAVLSPTGRYLAVGITYRNRLCLLNLKDGTVHLPTGPPAGRISEPPVIPTQLFTDISRWHVEGYDWLRDEDALIVALKFKGESKLYLLPWGNEKETSQLDLVRINEAPGSYVLPKLGANDTKLAWGFNPSILWNGHHRWRFEVANFDSRSGALGDSLSVPLSGFPTSITWNSTSACWLITLFRNEFLMVRETDGVLESTPVGALMWGDIELFPIGASSSPNGTVIAVTASLSPFCSGGPQIIDDALVQSMIFLWDGTSSQVQPLLEPSEAKLPRYVFPETESTRAQVPDERDRVELLGMSPGLIFEDATPTKA